MYAWVIFTCVMSAKLISYTSKP